MRNEFLKNGYYYNFFGDLMQLMHRILEKQDNEALDALYHMTGGFYHKYPQLPSYWRSTMNWSAVPIFPI